jgi:hypothetical protein
VIKSRREIFRLPPANLGRPARLAAAERYAPEANKPGLKRGAFSKMQNCTDCGRMTDGKLDGRTVCDDCRQKRNESQDERRREGDEKHGK